MQPLGQIALPEPAPNGTKTPGAGATQQPATVASPVNPCGSSFEDGQVPLREGLDETLMIGYPRITCLFAELQISFPAI